MASIEQLVKKVESLAPIPPERSIENYVAGNVDESPAPRWMAEIINRQMTTPFRGLEEREADERRKYFRRP